MVIVTVITEPKPGEPQLKVFTPAGTMVPATMTTHEFEDEHQAANFLVEDSGFEHASTLFVSWERR
ncbi:hypothetical protein ACIA8K_12820 [Catenuloplanes sp. NPDC051500]|uniref:hypothetical protein n=1 Tax=Catenuloplanes sp. NPDC051500 TaxID=3363959 RepID=UPI0037A38984